MDLILARYVLVVALFLPSSAGAQIQKAWEARYNNGGTNVSSVDNAVKLTVTNGFMYTLGLGGNDIQVVKYTTNGNPIWTAYYNGAGDVADSPEEMAVDSGGNVYVTGRSVDGSGVYWECVTVKFDSSGTQVWADRYSRTNAYHVGNSIALDINGNAYVAGVAAPYYLLVKYGSNGNRLWILLHTNSPPYEIAGGYTAVAVDRNGAIYVTGNGSGASRTARYDTAGIEVWAVNHWYYGGQSMGLDASGNIYTVGSGILKYSSTGILLWAQTNVPIAHVRISSAGNVYGAVRVLTTLPLTGYEMWSCKYSSNGARLWTNAINGTIYSFVRENPLAVDADENAYITGSTAVSGTGLNLATTRLDRNGNRIWVLQHDGPSHRNDEGTAILLDHSGSVYVAGYDSIPGDGMDFLTIKYSYLQNVQPFADGTRLIRFFGWPGRQYEFQASASLTADWQRIGSNITDNDGIVSHLDSEAPAFSKRFYKLGPRNPRSTHHFVFPSFCHNSRLSLIITYSNLLSPKKCENQNPHSAFRVRNVLSLWADRR